MSFIHSSGFAYIKNLIIGVGASVVLVGALFKIQSWPGASEMLTAGLLTEAGLFIMLGLLPPHKEYYWEKLYPGIDQHGGPAIGPGMDGVSNSGEKVDVGEAINNLSSNLGNISLDTTGLEGQQSQMLEAQGQMVQELQTMAKSMSSLEALQNADFGAIKEMTQGAGQFATALNDAINSISESLEDTKVYREQLSSLNDNLKAMNQVYGGVLSAMGQAGK
jgi:uncharacterized protein YoxC